MRSGLIAQKRVEAAWGVVTLAHSSRIFAFNSNQIQQPTGTGKRDNRQVA